MRSPQNPPPPRCGRTPATFVVVFAGETAYTTITARRNRLGPITLAEILYETSDEEKRALIRLKQTPVAFVDTFEAVLPSPPAVSTLRNGGESGGATWNEVQKLYVPPQFRGTFVLKRNGGLLQSGPLTEASDADAIQAALDSIVDDGGEFIVSELDGQNAVEIEFSGDMGGINQDLIEVEVIDNPPGDSTLRLTLDRPELAAALRGNTKGDLKLPIEIEATFENLANDELEDIVTWHGEVTILPEVTLPELAEAAPIEWLRPPSPVNYRPRGRPDRQRGASLERPARRWRRDELRHRSQSGYRRRVALYPAQRHRWRATSARGGLLGRVRQR